jgi:hypothetical protein
VNQHRLAGFESGNAMNELLCGHIVQDEADGFGGIDAGRYAREFAGRNTDILE